MFSLLPIAAIYAAQAGSLTYQEALDSALQANTSVLGAEADRASAEGRLLAANGTWDPTLTANVGQNTNIQQGRFQGIPFESDTTTRLWSAGVNQNFWTGTSWRLDYSGNSSNQLQLFNLSGVEQEQVGFLDPIRGQRDRDDHRDVDLRRELASAAAEQRDGHEAVLARGPSGADDVLRSPARGEAEEQIARTTVGLDLTGEDLLEAEVVGDAGEGRGVGEGEGR